MTPTLIIGEGTSDRWAPAAPAVTREPGRSVCVLCESPCDGARTILGDAVCEECVPRPETSTDPMVILRGLTVGALRLLTRVLRADARAAHDRACGWCVEGSVSVVYLTERKQAAALASRGLVRIVQRDVHITPRGREVGAWVSAQRTGLAAIVRRAA